MVKRNFRLWANVSSDNLSAVKPILKRIIADMGITRQADKGFEVEAELEGESARDLNRMVLSELRKAEKRTRIRAEWTSGDIIERFFDYVPKGTHQAKGK